LRGSFIEAELHACIGILGSVAGTTLEEIIVRLDIGCEVNDFASGELFDGVQYNGMTVMIGAFPVTGESDAADVFAAFGSIRRRDFIFREDGGIRTLRNASATVNAGIWVNIDPGPFCSGSGDHALNGADINTTAVTNA